MTRRNPRLLLAALGANAVFSGACALLLLLDADVIAPLYGDLPSVWLGVIGALLAGFVPFLLLAAHQASGPQPRSMFALVAIVLDLIWVVGSIILLPWVLSVSSTAGITLFLGVAFVVAGLAWLQWWGVGRLYAAADVALRTSHRIELTVDLDVSAHLLWPVIADLGGIDRYFDGLSEALVHGAPGVGAVRTCANGRGQRWSEEVTQWLPPREFAMRFQSERDDFPYPMDPMFGGWQIKEHGLGGSQVTVWWSFTTRPRWLSPALITLMLEKVRPDMVSTIHSMARAARAESARSRATA